MMSLRLVLVKVTVGLTTCMKSLTPMVASDTLLLCARRTIRCWCCFSLSKNLIGEYHDQHCPIQSFLRLWNMRSLMVFILFAYNKNQRYSICFNQFVFATKCDVNTNRFLCAFIFFCFFCQKFGAHQDSSSCPRLMMMHEQQY